MPPPETRLFTLRTMAGAPRIELRRIAANPGCGTADAGQAVIVFLHEGLGSVAAWRDFPDRLCAACGLPGLVYSRPGYGRSTPRAPHEHWDARYLHAQALEALPALLGELGIRRPWLFGHSDGATIALLHAAAFPDAVAGTVVLAPHVFVEQKALDGIARARAAYEAGPLRERLARVQADPDSAFYGWCDAWLAPAFRAWNIEADIAGLRGPLLAVQGEDDEYGTLEQLDRIARSVPHAERLVLLRCGHMPQRDAPQQVIDAARDFIARHRGREVPGTPAPSA